MRRLSRAGVALAYEERGQGSPPMVFVHGWSCDHRYFAPQVERFSQDHRAIAVDLRGHGETEAMLSTPRHVIATAWEQLRKVDGASAARACKVPVLFVNASTWRPELELFKALCPQLMLGQTVGAGHFNMLEVPDQVNAMIERFLALNAR